MQGIFSSRRHRAVFAVSISALALGLSGCFGGSSSSSGSRSHTGTFIDSPVPDLITAASTPLPQ